MPISALVAVGGVGADRTANISERTATLRIGDGTRGADMDPLVNRAHRPKVAPYVEAGEEAGTKS